MALRTILTEGDPTLRKVCRPVTKFDERLETLLDDMLETMYAAGKHLPIKLKETALGGCAATLSACERCGHCG